MKVGVIIITVLALLALPVLATHRSGDSDQCRTRSDCAKLLQATQVVCAQNFVLNREPDCDQGKCTFCKPVLYRPKSDCRYEADCTNKVTCAQGQYTRCIGSKCVCSAQQKPECYRDHDCVRPHFLRGRSQRMLCERGKCIEPPKATVTMTPRYAVRQQRNTSIA